MILIADSGATKADWCYGTSPGTCLTVQTEGINPFHQTEGQIRQILHKLPASMGCGAGEVTHVFFYGAGCLPEKSAPVAHALADSFPRASISVETDLLGVARALCKRGEGIACILGTGANSCLYDGRRIVQNIPPLGYILGDEGSGAYLGKRFVADCLKGQLPQSLRDGLLAHLGLDVPALLDRIYRTPHANRFLAGIAPYIYGKKDMPQVQGFLSECFGEFFRRNVLPYPRRLPVSFAGSVAWFFREEITRAAQAVNLTPGIFVKNPIEELARFHFAYMNPNT